MRWVEEKAHLLFSKWAFIYFACPEGLEGITTLKEPLSSAGRADIVFAREANCVCKLVACPDCDLAAALDIADCPLTFIANPPFAKLIFS